MYAFWNSTFKVLLVSEIYNNGLKEYILPLYLISFVQNYICTCVPHPDYNIVISLQLNFKKLKKLTKKNLKIVFVKFIQIVACRLSLLIFFFFVICSPIDYTMCLFNPFYKMATHSSTLAWKIPLMEEPGRLQSMGSQRVGYDWATSLSH